MLKRGGYSMNSFTWYVIDCRNKTNNKCFAYTERIHHSNNLIGYFERNKPGSSYEVLSVNACDTKKQAEQIATCWNEGYKSRGLYCFS